MFAHVMSLFMHVSAYNNNLIINMIINTKWIFCPEAGRQSRQIFGNRDKIN